MQPTFGWDVLKMSNRPSYRKEFEAKLRANRERAELRRMVLAFVISLISCLATFWLMGMAFGAELSPSTCKVVEFSPMGSVEAHGSGVLVAKADGWGYVLTAKHVAEKKPGNRMVVLFPRSFEFAFLSSAVTHAPDDIDLSLLMIDAPADIAPRPIAWRLPRDGRKGLAIGIRQQQAWPARVVVERAAARNVRRPVDFSLTAAAQQTIDPR